MILSLLCSATTLLWLVTGVRVFRNQQKTGEIHGENWVSIQHLLGYPQPQNLKQI